MSENDAVNQPGDGSLNTGAPAADSAAYKETVGLWVMASGWFVILMGAMTILAGIVWRTGDMDLPFLLLISMLLAGASYVIAGQALSAGYVWALPFVPISLVLSPLLLVFGPLTLFFVPSFRPLLKTIRRDGTLQQGTSDRARLAYGLLLAAFGAALLWVILNVGGHAIAGAHLSFRIWIP